MWGSSGPNRDGGRSGDAGVAVVVVVAAAAMLLMVVVEAVVVSAAVWEGAGAVLGTSGVSGVFWGRSGGRGGTGGPGPWSRTPGGGRRWELDAT